jgi:signal peptidase II
VTELADQPTEQPVDQGESNVPGESGEGRGSGRPVRTVAIVVLALVALFVITIDIVSKQIVVAHLREGEPVKWLGGALYLVLTRNSGAAFSMGSHITWLFPLISIGVIGWIVWMAARLRSVPWGISLGLVLGGAMGNLIDRVFRAPGAMRGEVVDFLSFLSPTGRHFAIFNLADSALVCGVVLAVLLELTGRRRDGSRVSR